MTELSMIFWNDAAARHALKELREHMKYHGDEASPEAEQLRNKLYQAMERLGTTTTE